MNDFKNFNWVKARKQCSLSWAFAQLRSDLQKDVERRNELRKPMYPNDPPLYAFGFKLQQSENQIVILREGISRVFQQTVFTLKDDAIEMEAKDKPNMVVKVGLNDSGVCALYLNGEERESWLIRKLALDDLFFGIAD